MFDKLKIRNFSQISLCTIQLMLMSTKNMLSQRVASPRNFPIRLKENIFSPSDQMCSHSSVARAEKCFGSLNEVSRSTSVGKVSLSKHFTSPPRFSDVGSTPTGCENFLKIFTWSHNRVFLGCRWGAFHIQQFHRFHRR